VKKSVFVCILLFALFYATLLSSMVVIPLVLASRPTADMAPVDRDSPVRERPEGAASKTNSHRELRRPQGDVLLPEPAAKQPLIESFAPDAGMIKPRKGRPKTIKA
jgi:hypothetical protein